VFSRGGREETKLAKKSSWLEIYFGTAGVSVVGEACSVGG